MSTLNESLGQKREALLPLRAKPVGLDGGPKQLKASAKAEGRSSIRRIRIRDFQIVSDSRTSGQVRRRFNSGPWAAALPISI
jgi:hypothetical protein